MSHPPINFNPMQLAEQSLNMAGKARGDQSMMLQNVTVALMGVMAVATASQVMMQLWREINRCEKGRER